VAGRTTAPFPVGEGGPEAGAVPANTHQSKENE
jgi:hypothetical protein